MPATEIWPWLAIAGTGALHGLNPASGWLLAAAWGWRSRDRRQAWRALRPIAAGHAASVALTALLVVGGLKLDRALLQVLAGAMLAASIGLHAWRRAPCATRRPAGQASLALGAFIGSSLHGAGLMLVPALMPFCLSNSGAGRAGAGLTPLLTVLAALAVHAGAMLAVTGLVAAGVCGGLGVLALRRRNCTRIGRGALRVWCARKFAPPGGVNFAKKTSPNCAPRLEIHVRRLGFEMPRLAIDLRCFAFKDVPQNDTVQLQKKRELVHSIHPFVG